MSRSVALDAPSRPRAGFDWRWVGARLLLLFPAAQLWATLSGGINPPEDSDYYLLYVHAEMARSGEALYWPWPDYGPHYGADGLRFPPDRIFYPPFLTPLLSALSRFGVEVFSHVWVVLLWGCYWVYAACLAKIAHGRITLGRTIAWGVVLFVLTGRAAQSAINLGNVDPLLWALFGLALAYPAARGAGFMGIALVKLYGAWPLIFSAVWRDRRTFTAGLATLGAAIVLASVALGPVRLATESFAWFQHMLPVAGQGTFNPYNVSLSFLGLRVARWFGWEYVSGPLPSLARTYLTLVGIAAPLLAAYLSRHAELRMRYAVIVCAAVFFAPLAWNFYTPLLLAPAALLLRRRSTGDPAIG